MDQEPVDSEMLQAGASKEEASYSLRFVGSPNKRSQVLPGPKQKTIVSTGSKTVWHKEVYNQGYGYRENIKQKTENPKALFSGSSTSRFIHAMDLSSYYRFSPDQFQIPEFIHQVHAPITEVPLPSREITQSIWFDMKDPVELFTGREKKLSDLHKKIQRNPENSTIISQITSITGLGGIGKTELARKYAYDHRHDYDGNVIWINAENHGTLEESFLKLADRLGISRDDNEKTIDNIIEEIYYFFAQRKSLFIFDNAEKFSTHERKHISNKEGIDRFLSSPLPSNVHKPRFLITSRNQEWGDIDAIQLDTFTEEEAADFIRNALNIENELQKSDIVNLVLKLQMLPLALTQAVEYMKDRNEKLKDTCFKFDISNYLISYDREPKKLLDFKCSHDSTNLYGQTTFTVWKKTVDKIRENKKYGKQAGEILDIIAYFAPDNIPVKLFLGSELSSDDREKICGAIQLIVKYSIINSEKNRTVLNVHRLVQQVIRIHLKDQNKVGEIVEKAFELLKINFDYLSTKSEDYLKTLLKWMCDRCGDLDDSVREKKLLEQISLLTECYYGADHFKIAEILKYIGNAYGKLGDLRKRNELLERAIKIEKNHHVSSYFQTADFTTSDFIIPEPLIHLGDAFGKVDEKLQRQIELRDSDFKVIPPSLGSNIYENPEALFSGSSTSRSIHAMDLSSYYRFPSGQFQTPEFIHQVHAPIMETPLPSREITQSIWFDMKDPVELFTGREKELSEVHNKIQPNPEKSTTITQIVIITGPGGIGKTELARKYAYDHRHDYDGNVIWINAETHGTLINSFLELATDPRIYISTKDKDWNEKDIENIVTEIYLFFTDKKSLFIFDNAEKYKTQIGENVGICGFLPQFDFASCVNKPRFLITSRNQEWGHANRLQLDTFTKTEAAKFIKNALNIGNILQEKDIQNLAKTLQYFPLALQQAVVYIKRRDDDVLKITGSKFDISDYLKRYYKHTKNLLGFQFPNDNFNLYTKTTFTTWQFFTDMIREHVYGRQAIEILDIIAYFAPNSIPIKIFLTLEVIGNDTKKLLSVIQLLKKYSIVSPGQNQTSLNIHGLVQQVTRILLKDQHREEQIVGEAFRLLRINFPYLSNKLSDYTKKRQLLPHLEAFLAHMQNWILEKPEVKYRIEVDYLESLLKWMIDGYGDMGNLRKKSRLLEQVLFIKEENYGPHHFEIADTLVHLGDAYGKLGDFQKGKELLERAIEIEVKHYGPDDFKIAETLVRLGDAYCKLGDLQKGKDLLERAIEIEVKHYGPDHFKIAETLVHLGDTYGKLGDFQKGKDLLERAIEIEVKHYGPDHFKMAETLVRLGDAYCKLGDLQKSKELLERALEIKENHYGHFKIVETLVHLGDAYGKLGDLQKRKELLERSLKIEENHYGPDHFKIAETLVHLSDAYSELGDLQKRKELLERALEIDVKHYGPDHFNIAETLVHLGDAYSKLGDLQKRKELLERALEIEVKHYGPDHFKIAETLVHLGDAYGKLGDLQKRKELLERSLEIEENHYGPDHFKIAETLVHLSDAYSKLGDLQKRKELLERALEIEVKHYGPDHFKIAETLVRLGDAYGKLGDLQKSKELLERAGETLRS